MLGRRLLLLAVCLNGGVAFAAPGEAPGAKGPAAEPDHVRVSYVAPSGCPEKSSLLSQISERVTIAWLADETELARQIRVVVEASATGFQGRMEYVDESGRRVTRSLEAPDCQKAVAGIALVTAIAIESQVAQAVPLGDETEPAPAPTRAEAAVAPAAVAKPTAPAPAEKPVDSRATRPASEDEGSSRARHEAGIFAGAIQGVGPGLAIGGAAFWGIGKAPFPLVRAIARWYETSEPGSTQELNAHFRLIAVGPELCYGSELVGPVKGALCGGVELGQYVAQGTTADAALFRTETHHLFWAAAELAAPVRLAGPAVFFELEPELRFPLVDATFHFQNPDELVYDVPRIAFGLNLGVGIAFQ